MVTRRGVLTAAAGVAAGGAAGAALTGALVSADGPASPAPRLDPNDWASVRAQHRLADEVASYDAFVLASHPATVRDAIERHRDGLDEDANGYLAANEARLDEAAAVAAAKYLDSTPDQVALTDSTTMGLGLLYTGLRLRPGDEVLTTEHDFYATHESLRLRQVRDGVTVRRVRLYDEPESADAAQMVQRLVASVTPATRLVAVTWVHSSSGVKLPIAAMAAELARSNSNRAEADRLLFCVDGVHGFGVEDTKPADLGCDFLVSGCHKWLFGPRGTGLVWGRSEVWPRVTPVVPSFSFDSIGAWFEGVEPTGPPGPAATPGGYHSFENRWALTEAFELREAIGADRVASRTQELATALKDGLAGVNGVRLRTPRSPEVSSGIVCCEVVGVTPRDGAVRLRRAAVHATPTPYATSYLRFGTSILTNESDVERAVSAVRDL